MTSGELTLPRREGLRPFARPRLNDRAVMVLVVVFTTLPVLGQFAYQFPLMDEGILLVYPEQILAGRTPHSDFFTVYGPGGFGLLATIYSVTGPSVVTERAVGLLYHIAIATGVVRLTSTYGRAPSCAAGMTSALILFPIGLTAYAWFGGLALVVWSVALLVRPDRDRVTFIGGVLGGLAAAWRVEMLVLLVAAVPLIWKSRLAKPYLSGIAIGLTPMVGFAALAGRELFDNFFLSRMALNAQLALGSVPVSIWFGVVLVVLLAGALTILALRRSSGQRAALAIAVLAVLLLPQLLQRIDVIHLIYVMCVIVPLGVGTLTAHAGNRIRQTAPLSPIVVSLVMLLLLTASAMSALNPSETTEITHSGRSIRVAATDAPRVAAEITLISKTIPRGSRIFVGASDMSVPTYSDIHLYHLLPEYRVESYYLELPPGVAEKAGSPLLQDVLHADALILTDVPRSRREALFPYMGRGVDTVNQAVAAHFCPAGREPPITVYLRCGPE